MSFSSPLLPRVLVVEDDGAIRETLCALLLSEGYRVVGVASLKEARAVLTDTLDALVLDLNLGDGSADSLLEELAPRLSAPPTMLLSASPDALGLARRYGVAFLSKPFDLDRLMTVLKDATPPVSTR